jgi:hypothetical protein
MTYGKYILTYPSVAIPVDSGAANLKDDEAVEIITHEAPEISVAQETESRKRAMARILSLPSARVSVT